MQEYKLYFVLPADRHLPSGGNIYNQKLLSALETDGQQLIILDFSTYQEAVLQDKAGCYWVDSLFLKDMQPLLHLKSKQAISFFICHHLDSLFPPAGKTSDEIFRQEEADVLRFFQGFLVTSSFSGQYLRKRGCQQPIMLVEPAAAIHSHKSKKTSSASNAPLQALMVANIIRRKGVLEWLTHVSQLATPTDHFFITIAGRLDIEQSYATACQEFVTSHAILQQRVVFTGGIAHEEVMPYYERSDLFVSAATMETFGMAIQEALACRLPVLALEGGYVQYHIDQGKNGNIFNSTPEMAKFFIDLVRGREKFISLQEDSKPGSRLHYTWEQAAFLFVQQLRAFFK